MKSKFQHFNVNVFVIPIIFQVEHLFETHVKSNEANSENKWGAPGKQRKTEKPEKKEILAKFLRKLQNRISQSDFQF